MISDSFQVQIRIRPISLNRHNLQRPSKVLSIQSGQWQSIPQSTHRGVYLRLTAPLLSHSEVRSVLFERVHRRCRVEIIPNPVDIASLNAAALVTDLHYHVRIRVSIADNHFDRRQLIIMLMHLHRRSHAILQQLEQNVPQNARNVRKRAVLLRIHLHRNRLSVLPIAHELRLFSTFNRGNTLTSRAASRRTGWCGG